jgi:hypothetical protein
MNGPFSANTHVKIICLLPSIGIADRFHPDESIIKHFNTNPKSRRILISNSFWVQMLLETAHVQMV